MHLLDVPGNPIFGGIILAWARYPFRQTTQAKLGGLLSRTQALLVAFFLLGFAIARPSVAQEGKEPVAAQAQSTPNSNGSATEATQDPAPAAKADDPSKSSSIEAPKPKANDDEAAGQQSKRILGIIPNYRAVSANTHLPPQRLKEKFWLATEDTFDYSNFILVGMLAGTSMASKSEPSFRQGAAGYGRYYWHVFVDTGVGNYMTEAIVPTLTKEDPRYYTLGKGGFFKRTGYAFSRLLITRTDGGRATFNFSEIVGNGAAAGIANSYYPAQANTFVKTYQRWGTQVGLDGVFNIFKEFWPDIDKAVFRQKY